jgi:hypothetical protein
MDSHVYQVCDFFIFFTFHFYIIKDGNILIV